MRYKRIINRDSNHEQLKSDMRKEGFIFGPLNYAAVIADVLAECSILSKKPNQLRYGMADAKKLTSAIAELRNSCLALAKNKIARLHPDTGSELLACCLGLEQARKKLKERTEFLAGFLPQLEPRPHSIKMINQIALLWARGFVDISGRILWEEACELFYWFIKYFENEIHYSELNSQDFDIDSMKKLFARLDKKYYLLFQSTSKCYYFPTGPRPPNIRVVFTEANEKAFPIISIEFYSNKIMTYFESKKGILARETSFREGGPVSTLFLNEPLKEQPEKENMLLEISRD